VLVVCEIDVEAQALSAALRRIRGAVCHEAMLCAVPPLELEDILYAALLGVPEGLDGRALEGRLLAEVRKGLAAWRATMALWDQREVAFRRAMEEGGLVEREKRPQMRRRRR
jgi:hypothetical protein